MKRKSELSLLMRPTSERRVRPDSAKRTTAAAQAARNGRRRTRPEPVTVPEPVANWLRSLPVSRMLPRPDKLSTALALAEQAHELGLVKLGVRLMCMTVPGLRTAYPWAKDFGYRSDKGAWEGYCPHGVGHPVGVLDRPCDGIHGCDGCCSGKGPFNERS